MMKLLFIRHAESTGNQQKRMEGQGNSALSDYGRKQATKLAQQLQHESWWPSQVYTSPLRRALETTEILLNQSLTEVLSAPIRNLATGQIVLPINPAVDLTVNAAIGIKLADELKEFQNGIFQGLTWAEARHRYPDLCHRLETTPDWLPIPEAESLRSGRARARQFIQHLMVDHTNNDHIWIITHSWILQHLIAELLGCDRSWRFRADNTALFEFQVDHSRWYRADQNCFNTDLWQILRFNETQHLNQ
ncbi:MAG: histidine phosphatase family protein [Cyanothece sp. SIO1E1]|nr:histidine phosphatase family protein [Cyanothece sp. SIO1E1]